MTKEEIKSLLELLKKSNGELTIKYIPESTLYDTKELYDLYYGGSKKIIISGNHFMKNYGEITDITESNLDEIVDKIYDIMIDNISGHIFKVFKNLHWEFEELKYFDHDKKTYNKFKKEVLKLKNITN